MKRILLLSVLGVFLCWSASVQAASWVVYCTYDTGTISTVDLSGAAPVSYGPFLGAALGGAGLTDLAITPDNRYALVSSVSTDRVYRVDISNPGAPVLAGAVAVSFAAEDIEVSPDGTFCVVTDANDRVATIELATFTLVGEHTMTTGTARAVAIAPDNLTVIFCDTYANQVIPGIINPATGAIVELAGLGTGMWPVNVTIGTDNTVIVANDDGSFAVDIMLVGALPGVVTATGVVGWLPGGQATVAFSPAGTEAYVLSTLLSPDRFSWLNVAGPGTVALGGTNVAALASDVTGAYFGVDSLAVTIDGRFAVATNAASTGAPYAGFSLVNLVGGTFPVAAVASTDGGVPAGVAAANLVLPAPVPVFTGWGLFSALGLLLLSGVFFLRRRHGSAA